MCFELKPLSHYFINVTFPLLFLSAFRSHLNLLASLLHIKQKHICKACWRDKYFDMYAIITNLNSRVNTIFNNVLLLKSDLNWIKVRVIHWIIFSVSRQHVGKITAFKQKPAWAIGTINVWCLIKSPEAFLKNLPFTWIFPSAIFSQQIHICSKWILLHVHPLLGKTLVNKFPRNRFLVNSPLLRYETIEKAVFSMSSAPSNSRNGVLCDQLLGYATVTQVFLKLFQKHIEKESCSTQASLVSVHVTARHWNVWG
jgi:hypothetical protein